MTPAERDEIRRLWQDMEEPGNKLLWNYYVAMRDPVGTVIALHGPLPTLHDAVYSQLSYKIDLGDWWLSHGYRVTEVFQADSPEEAEIVAAKCKAAASYAYASQFEGYESTSRIAAVQRPRWYRKRVALGGFIVASIVFWPIIWVALYGPATP